MQDYIAPDDGTGLAPIGAIVTVAAPTSHVIDYNFGLSIKEGADKATTINNIQLAFNEYYKEVGIGGLLRYNILAAKISTTEGVEDFTKFTINWRHFKYKNGC